MADSPTTLFPNESDEDIFRRLAADLGNPPNGVWNLREGSQIYTLLKPLVQEHRRFTDFAEFITSLGFLEYSEGAWLDSKALEYGAIRKEAVAATVIMTFVGDEGTLIPAGTTVATESQDGQFDGIVFSTTADVTIPVLGLVQVTAIAQVAGLSSNVGAGDITLLTSSIPGVTSIYNETAAIGGLDIEDNESLRSNALFRAQSIPQSGNKATYAIMALDDAEVETVYVEDFWDQSNGNSGNGTTRVVIGGGATPHVSTTTVERLQEFIDPTIKNIAHFENEVWTGGVEDIVTPIEGQASRTLTSASSTTTQMELTKTLQLGSFDSNTYDEVWLSLKRVTGTGTLATNALIIRFFSPGGASVGKAEATVTAATINALTNITVEGLLKIVKSGFTITNGSGTFSWNDIAGVTIGLTASGSGPATVAFDGMRIRRGRGGFPSGEATLGTQITVRSARTKAVAITANIVLSTGLVLADVQALAIQNITNYLDSIVPGGTVRINDIGNALHDTDGIIDYNTVQINASSSNLVLTSDQRPIIVVAPILTVV